MKWITSHASRILGLTDSSDFFEPQSRKNNVRLKVAAGAATIAGIAIVMISVLTSAVVSGANEVVIPRELEASSTAQTPQEITQIGSVLVHVVGEVNIPGMYELPQNSRLIDAVMAAGGLAANAGECGVNLARYVKDGEQINIPASQDGCNPQPGNVSGQPVSLNQGTAEQIDTLPGIGPTLAQRIVQWRESNGGFNSIEQLNDVSGIGDKLYAGIKDLVAL
jgi:competence protein ComEA